MDKKSILLGAAAFFAASLSAQDVQMKQDEKKEGKKEIINPFYGDYSTPYRTVPFGEISLEDYIPAIEKGIEIEKAEIKAITDNPAEPTFENTIAAMQRSGEM